MQHVFNISIQKSKQRTQQQIKRQLKLDLVVEKKQTEAVL